jgi:parallel beta-helix repeat protein
MVLLARLLELLPALCLLFCSSLFASTINVPADQTTIQAGINAAQNGDTVLVAPGIYQENISFTGKAITVTSSGGAAYTTIRGNQHGSVVIFNSGETSSSVLNGFTITNGSAQNQFGLDQGGGVIIVRSSPTVTNNKIQNNHSCGGGDGLALIIGAPLVKGNTIQKNSQKGCTGGEGGAVTIGGGQGAMFIGNRVIGNQGGFSLVSASNPLIQDNIIAGNTGYGLSTANDSNPIVVQNLIYGNGGFFGGGVYLAPSYGTAASILVSNTIVDNMNTSTGMGTDLYTTGFISSSQIINNIFASTTGTNSVYCDPSYDKNSPIFQFNDSYSSGTAIEGTCTSEIGLDGNLSADPGFKNPTKHNYRLAIGSPLINAGTNSAPDLPSQDIAGKPRIVGGTVDIGAYEFQ